MIVPMQRVTLLCLLKDRESALERLRDMGVIHLVAAAAPASADLDAARRRHEDARTVADLLARQARPATPAVPAPADEVIAEVLGLLERRKAVRAARETLDRECRALEPFGAFEPDSIRALARGGVSVRLWVVPRRARLAVPEGGCWVVLHEDAAARYGALVGAPEAAMDGREVPLPERSLAACRQDLEACGRDLDAIDLRLAALAGACAAVGNRVAALRDDLAFLEARDGMGQAGELTYLQGYGPADCADGLRAAAARHGWGLVLADPAEGEAVPTLLRNSRWVEPVKCLFHLIGITPGYREVDISGVFLLFYSVFFAMLVGDAGYGVVFLALTLVLRRFARRIPPELPRLLGVLSAATIVWGMLSGTYFGIRADLLPAPLRGVRIAWLAREDNLMALCFLIGAIHLTVAHIWSAVRLRRTLAAVAQLGWVAITWTMYGLAQAMILDRPLPDGILAVFLAGLAAVVLFMTPWRALKTQWAGHAMLPLTVISSFGDVVSYVRLFAVGSAGAAISLAFNDMAVGGGVRGFGAGLAAALILFLAHALNILLAALAVIVHGVRLNTLEFSGHLGLQWAGFPFRPFRREAQGGPARADG